MNFLDILLIILSSAGLLHGVVFAVYLILVKNKRGISNLLLGLILVFMAFRIGKSVVLNFGNELEPIFIFAGLAFLLIIGPLLKWYVFSMLKSSFKLDKLFFIEFTPFVLFFISSLFVTKEWYENGKMVIVIFSSGLIFIYLHLAVYIGYAWRYFNKFKKERYKQQLTKSQSVIYNWIRLLLLGFMIIWCSYVLNILDEAIPYVTGPIMYSIVIYYLSFKAIQSKALDLDSSVFETNKNQSLFEEITTLIESKKLYLEPDFTLSKLSAIFGISKQQLSLIVNQYAQTNFNDYINHYRINTAKNLFLDSKNDNYTIAAIAFDSGFSSLSSFNSAFKKFEDKTPSNFRKEIRRTDLM